MLDFKLPEAQFADWFRGLPRHQQWLWGVPILGISLWGLYHQFTTSWGCSDEMQPKQGIWVTLLLFAATIVLNELLRPKPNLEDQRPAGLGDFQFPTATEGRVVPIIFGRNKVEGPNVVWYGDLGQDAIQKRIKTGLFSSTSQTIGFRYSLGVQMALCRGGTTVMGDDHCVLRRVWIGDREVSTTVVSGAGARFDIDKPELFGGDELGNGGIQATVDFYPGTQVQGINDYLDTTDRQRVASATTPTCPRYTGTCYVVIREMTGAAPAATDRGAYLGNSTQIEKWGFEIERFPSLFSGQSAGDNKINSSKDANPLNVAYELFVNAEWGFGFDPSTIDVGIGSSFLAAADTMITEQNGFSMILDRNIKAKDLLAEIERQIDGVFFLDNQTGLWTVKLARDDYTIGSVAQVSEDDVLEIRDFTRGSWEDTSNQVVVKYSKRDDDYKESHAIATDTANSLIRGNGTTTGNIVTNAAPTYPGVKSSALAANLAWRDLRGLSFPLARATFRLRRKFRTLKVGDVFAWTDSALGFSQLPMRISRIDYGRPGDNAVSVTAVQDVFRFAAASYGTPGASGWNPPATSLIAYPSDQQLAFEAPRGIVIRDPDAVGFDETVSRVLCAARRQTGEVAFQIGQRNDPTTPGGSYADAGRVLSFVRIGALDADLDAGSAYPLSSLVITATPDTQANLETAFDDSATLTDLGVDLAHLILVGDEFMLVSSASNSGADVALANVYRGVLDSAQAAHSAGDDVYLLHLGAGLSETTFENTYRVDIELRAQSASETFAGVVTAFNLTMAKRMLRPAPPSAVLYNGSSTIFNTPDLEDNGSGENGQQFAVDWRRRRYDVADEVQALLADEDPDGASGVSGTEFQVSVFVDPSGSNTEIASSPFTWTAGTGTIQVPRLEILDIAAAGTEIAVEIQSRHDIGSETNLTSRQTLSHAVTPTSVNDGLFHLGSDIGAAGSNAYTVATAGAHTIRIGAAMTTANAEYRINGGSWTTIGGTSATTAALSISDTIEVRTSSGTYAPDPNFVSIDNPSATRVAYGTL